MFEKYNRNKKLKKTKKAIAKAAHAVLESENNILINSIINKVKTEFNFMKLKQLSNSKYLYEFKSKQTITIRQEIISYDEAGSVPYFYFYINDDLLEYPNKKITRKFYYYLQFKYNEYLPKRIKRFKELVQL